MGFREDILYHLLYACIHLIPKHRAILPKLLFTTQKLINCKSYQYVAINHVIVDIFQTWKGYDIKDKSYFAVQWKSPNFCDFVCSRWCLSYVLKN